MKHYCLKAFLCLSICLRMLPSSAQTDVDAIEPVATERASDARPCNISYGERASQSAEKPSLLGRLHSKQAIVNEAKGNNTPEKKHEQSL